jgi:hypothetical protein
MTGESAPPTDLQPRRDTPWSVWWWLHAALVGVLLVVLLVLCLVARSWGGDNSNSLQGITVLLLAGLGAPWSLLVAFPETLGDGQTLLVLAACAVLNLAIHDFVARRSVRVPAAMAERSMTARVQRSGFLFLSGLAAGVLIVVGISWLVQVDLHHDDRDAGRRYAKTLDDPQLNLDRTNNDLRVRCELAANAFYDNVMFSDARGDWAPADQQAFYAGCTEGVVEPASGEGGD